MKFWIPSLVLVLSFLTASARAKNQCLCQVLPSTKVYQGEARKKHFIGYSIDWACTYKCNTDPRDLEANAALVTASYHEFYMFQEEGSEGICEGMYYKSYFNLQLNRAVYAYTGENFDLKPSESRAPDLKKWAEANYCD